MTIYLNCDKPEQAFGNIKCKTCNAEYKFEFDTIKTPYKESGTLKCDCGANLVSWSSTIEPFLVKVNNQENT